MAGDEVAHGAQILQYLGGGAGDAAQVGLEDGVEDPLVDVCVELQRDLVQHAAAHPFQGFHDEVEHDDQQGQHAQGRQAAAVHHGRRPGACTPWGP
jgi:hypothetical protein